MKEKKNVILLNRVAGHVGKDQESIEPPAAERNRPRDGR
jgi:hypothetical protein